MPRFTFRSPAALESIEDVSDSSARELYRSRHTLVDLTIELQKDTAWPLFNALSHEVLPRLPHGYRWARAEGKHAIIRDQTAPEYPLTLVLYGPDNKNRINYIFQVDGVTTFGFGHTRTTAEPTRDYPMTLADYRVPDFDYSKHQYKQHVRGHIIDHKDTIQEKLVREGLSTYDSRNYIPEPPDYDWGLGIRKSKVGKVRGNNGAYSQFMEYTDEPLLTQDKTPVPNKIYFTEYSVAGNKYTPQEVYNVDFSENFSRPSKDVKYIDHAASAFTIDVESAPIVVPYSPDSTDRTLRLFKRNSMKKANQITEGDLRSRFPDRDGEYAYCDAADVEVDGVSRRLFAGQFANVNRNSDLGLEYVKRSLFFGGKQLGLDGDAPIIDKAAQKAGEDFFRDYAGDKNLDGLEDQFNQLCKDQPGVGK